LGVGREPIGTSFPKAGWAEQSPAEWSRALAGAIRTAVAESRVPVTEIGAISADGTTCTVVLLDEAGEPIRDAMLWMDVRAHREAAEVAKSGDSALAYVGNGPVSAEWLVPKLLWMERNLPRELARAESVLELTDWLVYHMSGVKACNINTASMRGFYNDAGWGMPLTLYRSVGLAGVAEKIPPNIARPGDVAGTLTASFAVDAGLSPDTLVVTGGADAPVGLIGMGVVKPGRVGIITGSSHVHAALLEEEVHVRGLFGSYPNGLIDGLQLIEGGQVSTGSVLRWFADSFAGKQMEEAASERGLSALEVLVEEASSIPPGAEGLLVLDHFQGNRTPWTDPTSRGVIRGLTLHHTPAHLARAVMEGVAYGTAVIVERMREVGVPVEEIVLCGGAGRGILWPQIHADVTGLEIAIPAQQEAPLLGSAILAMTGAGEYPDIQSAAAAMTSARRVLTPDPERHNLYRAYVEQYRATYHALKDESAKLVGLSSGP
jgi:ribulokinase